MTTTGREIIDVLEKYTELDWYRFHRIDRSNEQMTLPPIVVWRFKISNNQLTEEIKRAVDGFGGVIEWHFEVGKNCAIYPQKLAQILNEGKVNVDVQASLLLSKENPGYCELANKELPKLAKYIKKCILQSWGH